jgi:hypothetical protein
VSTHDDGGPAFPSGERLSIDAAGRRDDRLAQPLHDGMTLRDWFAGQAIAGWGEGSHGASMTVGSGRAWDAPLDTARDYAERMASFAYLVADAMLAARATVTPTQTERES